MEEFNTRYGYTVVDDNEFTGDSNDEELCRKLYALFTEFEDGSAWIRAKWARNRRVFLAQGLGIPLGRTGGISPDAFSPLNQRDVRCNEAPAPMTSSPILYSTYENLVSDAIEMQPEAVFLGRSQDDGDRARDMTAIMRCFLERRNFKQKYTEWVRYRSQYGMAIVETVYDDSLDGGEGDMDIDIWSPFSIFLDPLCENLQDGRAVFKRTYHHRSWYKEHYPDAYTHMMDSSGNYEDLVINTAQKEQETIPLYECWCRKFDAKKNRFTINRYRMAGGTILDNSERHPDTKNGVFAHGEYPFTASYYEKIEGTPWGLGPIDYLTPVQQYISDMDDMIYQNLYESAVPRAVYTSSSGLTEETLSDRSRHFIEIKGSDINQCFQWAPDRPLPPAALQMYFSKTETLKTESGQNAASRGEVPGSVTAAAAINMLQSAGSKRANLSQFNLNNSFSLVVRQLVSGFYQFYDEERYFRIPGTLLEEDHLYKYDPKVYNEHGGWQYDLEVKVQRESSFQTAYNNQTVMTFVQMGALDPADAVKMLDIPNHAILEMAVVKYDKTKKTISDLMQEVERLRGEVSAAQQENQKLMETAAAETEPPENASTPEMNPQFAQAGIPVL